jgi:hypothetical protein
VPQQRLFHEGMAEDQLHRLLQNAFPMVKVVEGQVLIRQPPFPRAHGVAAPPVRTIPETLRFDWVNICAGELRF